eukprot:scaffold774_cov75-Cylindrotheca_fusiformis.AAC.9
MKLDADDMLLAKRERESHSCGKKHTCCDEPIVTRSVTEVAEKKHLQESRPEYVMELEQVISKQDFTKLSVVKNVSTICVSREEVIGKKPATASRVGDANLPPGLVLDDIPFKSAKQMRLWRLSINKDSNIQNLAFPFVVLTTQPHQLISEGLAEELNELRDVVADGGLLYTQWYGVP